MCWAISLAAQLASAKRALEASTAHAAELQHGMTQAGRELSALREAEATLKAELLDARGRLGALQTAHEQAVQERASVLASLASSQSQCAKLEARLAALVLSNTALGKPDAQSEVRGSPVCWSESMCNYGAMRFQVEDDAARLTQVEHSPEPSEALAATQLPESGTLHARAAQLERLLMDVAERAEAAAADRLQLQQQAAASREELRAMRQRLDAQSAELISLQSLRTNRPAPPQALSPPHSPPPASPAAAVMRDPPSPATPASTSASGASKRDTLTDQDSVVLYQGG
jgi:chromosome segregation ATPase